MKRILTLLVLISFFSIVKLNAQCTPDFSFTSPGIYPNCDTNLPISLTGQAYSTVITIVVPKDTVILGNTIPIDSIGVDSISGLPGGFAWAPNRPSGYWFGDSTGCAIITGNPSIAQMGIYQLTVYISAYGFGFSLPSTITCYEINITDQIGIECNEQNNFEVSQNTPNPFSKSTEIAFNSEVYGDFHFIVYSIMGEVVYQENIKAKPGENRIVFEANDLRSGIYMYKITNGKQAITKRMIISDKK